MSTPKFHWLFSMKVETTHTTNGKVNEKRLNVLVLTTEVNIRQVDLATAQEAACRRFATECKQIPGFKITDCYIEGFSLLGQMTTEEFTAGIQEPSKNEIN